MGEKIVLIDGHSILNRAFYGLPGHRPIPHLHVLPAQGPHRRGAMLPMARGHHGESQPAGTAAAVTRVSQRFFF